MALSMLEPGPGRSVWGSVVSFSINCWKFSSIIGVFVAGVVRHVRGFVCHGYSEFIVDPGLWALCAISVRSGGERSGFCSLPFAALYQFSVGKVRRGLYIKCKHT